jgi:arylsulfatase A
MSKILPLFETNLRFGCILFCSFTLLISCTTVDKSSPPPNIIFIMADDLGYGDLSFTGQKQFETPNIDQLAKDGMFFSQHYSGSTVCGPSRSSLMTGYHSGHTYIRGNREVFPEGQFPIADSVLTVAELLKTKGYVTGVFGKWGLGYPGSEGDPNQQGFDEFYGYNCQRLAHNYYPYHLWNNQEKIILEGNTGTQTNQYAPELIHQKALSFIEDNHQKSFFLYYPSIIPHAELAAPERWMEKYHLQFAPEQEYIGVDESSPHYKNGWYASQKHPRAAFAAMISLLDEQVGEIRRKVEELGIAENTLILFTSDNGSHWEGGADPEFFNSSAGFRGHKRDLYEGGIRVPLIAHWPETILRNSKTKHISAFWDFLPTACEIAGLKTPKTIDGISYYQTLIGKPQKEHEFLYWEFHEQGGKQALRLDNWKGVRLNMSSNPDAPIALYDLLVDKEEQRDISLENPVIVNAIDSIIKNEHTHSKAFLFPFEKQIH